MILVIHAHPYPRTSRATAALLEAVRDLPSLEVRSLYDLSPDFDIDVAAEGAALQRADLIVLLHPVYWYTVPGILKQWMDVVLTWAQSEGGVATRGKECLWAIATDNDYDDCVPMVERAARYCGMRWLEPFVVAGARDLKDEELRAKAGELRTRLQEHA